MKGYSKRNQFWRGFRPSVSYKFLYHLYQCAVAYNFQSWVARLKIYVRKSHVIVSHSWQHCTEKQIGKQRGRWILIRAVIINYPYNFQCFSINVVMRIGFSSIMLKRTWVKYSPVLSVDESEMILFFIFKITFKITI